MGFLGNFQSPHARFLCYAERPIVTDPSIDVDRPVVAELSRSRWTPRVIRGDSSRSHRSKLVVSGCPDIASGSLGVFICPLAGPMLPHIIALVPAGRGGFLCCFGALNDMLDCVVNVFNEVEHVVQCRNNEGGWQINHVT